MIKIKSITAILVLTFLFSLLLSCQNTDTDSLSANTGKVSASKISDLLKSLQMFEFEKGVPALEFELENLKGEKVSLSQYKGKVVVLSFWTTW